MRYQFEKWVNKLDPDFAYLKQAVRTGCAALIAVILFRMHFFSTPEDYWIILGAAFLMQTRLGDTQFQQIATILICTLSAAFFSFLIGFLWGHTLLLALFLAFVIFITTLLGGLGTHIAIAAFFVGLFIIMSGGLITNFAGQIERAYMIGVGGMICLLMSFLWPTTSKKNLENFVKKYFLCLKELTNVFYQIYLFADDQQKEKKFSKEIQEYKNHALKLLSLINSNNEMHFFAHFLSSIISMGNIRHRLQAFPKETYYKIEMQNIYKAVSINLETIFRGKKSEAIGKLQDTINDVRFQLKDQSIKLQEIFIPSLEGATHFLMMVKNYVK